MPLSNPSARDGGRGGSTGPRGPEKSDDLMWPLLGNSRSGGGGGRANLDLAPGGGGRAVTTLSLGFVSPICGQFWWWPRCELVW